jgi:hypothetical protein
MNTELKFGTRVLAWNYDKSEAVKGKFVTRYKGYRIYPYCVLPDGNKYVNLFTNCELDPDATEFLSGDVVEVSHNKLNWQTAKFVGKIPIDGYGYGFGVILDSKLTPVHYCRYPQPKKEFIFTSDMSREQITNQVDEMLKTWGVK